MLGLLGVVLKHLKCSESQAKVTEWNLENTTSAFCVSSACHQCMSGAMPTVLTLWRSWAWCHRSCSKHRRRLPCRAASSCHPSSLLRCPTMWPLSCSVPAADWLAWEGGRVACVIYVAYSTDITTFKPWLIESLINVTVCRLYKIVHNRFAGNTQGSTVCWTNEQTVSMRVRKRNKKKKKVEHCIDNFHSVKNTFAWLGHTWSYKTTSRNACENALPVCSTNGMCGLWSLRLSSGCQTEIIYITCTQNNDKQ